MYVEKEKKQITRNPNEPSITESLQGEIVQKPAINSVQVLEAKVHSEGDLVTIHCTGGLRLFTAWTPP